MRTIGKLFRFLLLLVFVTILLFFSFHNRHDVSVELFSYSVPAIPLAAVIIVALFIGVIVTSFITVGELIALHARLRKREKEVRNLNKQLTEMKQRPLLNGYEPGIEPTEDNSAEPNLESAGS